MHLNQICRLDLSTANIQSTSPTDGSFEAVVTGVLIGERRHFEDASRRLFYFRTKHLDHGSSREHAPRAKRRVVALSTCRTVHQGTSRPNELSLGTNAYVSTDGYVYCFDGWYDEDVLLPIDGPGHEAEIPDEWLEGMEKSTAACEVRYLCYIVHPWFGSPFHSLRYLSLPEKYVCYSVHICHRCLSPFFSQEHMAEHLEGYCDMLHPPGVCLYHDRVSERKVFYVDGAQHLHYCRCLSLLGKCFLESKILRNDVDIYEYYVVTIPRRSLPYIPGSVFTSEEAFRDAASTFDEQWSGDVVVSYFSRLKHRPCHTLSCIVTLPMFQHMRLGSLMVDIAYFLTAARQRQCGCASACGNGGGAISRPFSPHGQALLVSFWRSVVMRTLWLRDQEGLTNHFRNIEELLRVLPVPICKDDMEFALLHGGFAFYSQLESGEVAMGTATVNGTGRPSGTASTYLGTLAFDHEEAARLCSAKEPAGGFLAKWMRRDRHGDLLYTNAMMHY